MKAALVVAALALSVTAYAQLLGTLVRSQIATSVTGQLMSICTYQVGTQQATVNVPGGVCPPSMQFR